MPRKCANGFCVGDIVRVLNVPDWLVADLPESEKSAILACVGKEMTISDVDEYDALWVGFGQTTESEEGAEYVGQSFVVEAEQLELVRRGSD